MDGYEYILEHLFGVLWIAGQTGGETKYLTAIARK
jgi:hypothetical protein